MAKRRKLHNDTETLAAEAKALLDNLGIFERESDLRDYVLKLVPVHHKVRDIGCSLIPGEVAPTARERILHYFRRYPRTLIDADELLVISGISEWARRVRELRVQYGWWIYSGMTFQEMEEATPEAVEEMKRDLPFDPSKVRPDQYVLIREEEDRDAAHRWNVLNEIRRKKISVKDKLLEYLRRNVGRPVTGEELRYLAGDAKEWARRTRELRTEDGWPVVTRMQGREDLPVGAYLLEEDRQAEPHDRRIPDPVRIEVLKRDNFACTSCGWDRSRRSPDDPRKFLELHHITFHAEKGENTAENLITLCNVCHDDLHRKFGTASHRRQA